MSIINEPPRHVKREYALEEPVALVVEKYATFTQSEPWRARATPKKSSAESLIIARMISTIPRTTHSGRENRSLRTNRGRIRSRSDQANCHHESEADYQQHE